MKRLYPLLLFLMLCAGSFGQNYTRDAGARFGDGVFLTYRQFFYDQEAVEVMAGFSKYGFRLIGMKQYFHPLARNRSENLNFVYGYGIHAGITYTNKFQILNRVYYHDWKWSPQFGFDGIAGFEYAASEYPFLVRAAIHPYFEYSLNKYFNVDVFNFVVSFNYRF